LHILTLLGKMMFHFTYWHILHFLEVPNLVILVKTWNFVRMLIIHLETEYIYVFFDLALIVNFYNRNQVPAQSPIKNNLAWPLLVSYCQIKDYRIIQKSFMLAHFFRIGQRRIWFYNHSIHLTKMNQIFICIVRMYLSLDESRPDSCITE